MSLCERATEDGDDPDMVIIDHEEEKVEKVSPCTGRKKTQSDGFLPLSPRPPPLNLSLSPIPGAQTHQESCAYRVDNRGNPNLNITILGGDDYSSSSGESLLADYQKGREVARLGSPERDQLFSNDVNARNKDWSGSQLLNNTRDLASSSPPTFLQDSVFLPELDSSTATPTSSSTSIGSSTTPTSEGGTVSGRSKRSKFRHKFQIQKLRSASYPVASCSSSCSDTSDSSSSRRNSTPERDEFNSWQFWREEYPLLGLDKVDHQAQPSSIRVSLSDSIGSRSTSSQQSGHYYYLIPCTECLKNSVNLSPDGRDSAAEWVKRRRNPSVIYVEETLSFCGHRRTLTQTSAEHVFSVLASSPSEPELVSLYSVERRMGNQAGKEGKDKGAKGGKDKDGKKSGSGGGSKDKKGNVILDGKQGVPGKSLKNRPAPPPPTKGKSDLIT